jgi:general secretion pathway protein A
MYASHFGLRKEPFSLTPDPSFLYLSPNHGEALAGLKIGLESRRGLMLMIAEVGMGKTTLLYSMLDQLQPEVHTAYLSNTRLSFDDLLRQGLADLGVPCASRDRVDLLATLNTFLHERAAAGETAALIIDEAQNLDEETFENLRLLSNYETYTDKLLQIVLVGQPELDVKLARPSLRQVTERVAVRCHINPLTRAESLRYLEHRMQVAGGSTAVFTRAALELIIWKSRGIPRRLNIITHSALLFAYGRGASRVTFREARAAIREKQGRGLVTIGPRRRVMTEPSATLLRPWRLAAATAAGMGLIAIGWGSSNLAARSAALPEPVAKADRVVSAAEPAAVAPIAAPVANEAPAAAPEPAPEPEAMVPPSVAVATAENVADDEHPASAAAPATPTSPSYRQIVVPRGTSLLVLAQQFYGEYNSQLIKRIRELNPQIVDANHIYAGDTLKMPELDAQDRSRE